MFQGYNNYNNSYINYYYSFLTAQLKSRPAGHCGKIDENFRRQTLSTILCRYLWSGFPFSYLAEFSVISQMGAPRVRVNVRVW